VPADPWAEKAMLDWCLGGATPTQPASRFLGLAAGTPTSASASELVTGFASTRLAIAFGAAVSPAGSATNTGAVTFSATTRITAAASKPNAWNLWNASSGGTRLAYGQLSASSTFSSGDTISFASGALTITLA